MEMKVKLVLKRYGPVAAQLVHFVLALGMLGAAIAEYAANPPVFDVVGRHRNRGGLPDGIFRNLSSTTAWDTTKVIDLPVLFLFVVYFLTVLWLKCSGVRAWLLTFSEMGVVLVFLIANLWSDNTLPWVFFTTRSVSILLTVLALAMGWSLLIITLLHIRNWFPFKIKKKPVTTSYEKAALIVWNIFALFLVLTLCMLLWFARLYRSWACVKGNYDVLLLCQFTSQTQCWPCDDGKTCSRDDACVDIAAAQDPFHCLSPLYAYGGADTSGFCVFNYNIGAFTILTLFAYVGGLYFFLRTTLNAFLKCLGVFLLVWLKYCRRTVCKPVEAPLKDEEEGTARVETDKHSLLASLPSGYQRDTSAANFGSGK